MRKRGWGRFLLLLALARGALVCPAQEAASGGNAGPTTVTIMNARSTAYGKDPVTGGDAITFTGNVELKIETGGSAISVKAEDVRYNRENRLLYARGGITLEEKKTDGTTEKLSASSLLLNTDTMEGIFDESRITSLGKAAGSSSGAAGTTLIGAAVFKTA